MISLKAFGALLLVLGALVYVLLLVAHRFGKHDGVEEYKQQQSERRSLRRMESRASAYSPRHQAAPWPGPDPDHLASTDQLRELSAAAERGDLGEIRRTNAAFLRVHDWWGWTRKDREHAA